MLDGANGIDIIGEFPKTPADPSNRERHNPLIGRTKADHRQQRFYLAVRNRAAAPTLCYDLVIMYE
jgi:hypothetical protein